MKKEYQKLITLAEKAKLNAHAPYSNFKVGVALLTSKGEIFSGCNIENSSYGLTICAERVAIFKAISCGQKKFKAMAIVSDSENFTSPCGACRQVLFELAGNIDFIMKHPDKRIKIIKLNSLLPLAFTEKDLNKKLKKK